MQFFILLIGVLVFVFYLFNPSPVHWNAANVEAMRTEDQMIRASEDPREVRGSTSAAIDPHDASFVLQAQHTENAATIATSANAWVAAHRADQPTGNEQLATALAEDTRLREAYRTEVEAALPAAEANDKDYIFITWVMDNLPVGVVGLLLAMIFSAGMGSTSSQLSALATTAVVDVFRKQCEGRDQVIATKWATIAFGVLALLFAAIFPLFDNLIQAVNILGSLFYGTILGIFLVAFFLKRVGGTAVFIAALVSQAVILAVHFSGLELAFLWYNLIAPTIVVVIALLIPSRPSPVSAQA